jgi:hypothetical protein
MVYRSHPPEYSFVQQLFFSRNWIYEEKYYIEDIVTYVVYKYFLIAQKSFRDERYKNLK